MPLTSETQQLVALFNAGRYADVEARARSLIALHPDFGFAWKALGTAVMFRGGDAIAILQASLEHLPNDPEVHSNLGTAFLERGRPDDAARCYRRALEIRPDYAQAHSNLGSAMLKLGQRDEAVRFFRRAVELKPDFPEAHTNLGSVLLELGQLDEAVRCHQRALQLNPQFALAHTNLGNAMLELGRRDEAVLCHRRALEVNPNYAAAHIHLGSALLALDQLDEAVQSCRRAVELTPNVAAAHNNLGNVLLRLGRPEEAERCFRRVVELEPGSAHAHSNLGDALKDLGQLSEAMHCYQRALELNPDAPEVHSNLLFTMNYLHAQPRSVLREEAQRFGARAARKANAAVAWPNLPEPLRQLRVGLVSGDLHSHPVGFFLQDVVAALSPERMKIIVYQTRSKTDGLTERLKTHASGWNPVMGVTDEHLAQQIRSDGIDILIDLSGHNAHNRLPVFAWKPAPIQVAWLGYFATTGVPGVDYILVDPWAVPPGEEDQFTEAVWHLPETRLCFSPPESAGDVAPLPALASGCVTFGCFGNLAKINDAVVSVWARVLNAVPGARLFLRAKQLADAGARAGLLKRFADRDIAAHRLIIEGPSSRADYLAAYGRIDIVLDTFPFPGGTTTFEALWMGVPVVTLRGDRLLSRQGESILMNAGLKDWIAADADEFVRLAATHSANLQALSQLRSGLRQQVQASPLFDAPRFAAHFDAALRGMWKKWCSRQSAYEA